MKNQMNMENQNIRPIGKNSEVKHSKNVKSPNINYWVISTFLLLGILFFVLFLKWRQSSSITQKIDIQTPSAVISENQNATLEKFSDNWTGAELFIPFSDSKLGEKWTAYVNWDYDISFLFPASWRVDLLDDHLTINRLTGCRGCGGGGFMGIRISYYKNVNNLSLEKLFPYTSWDKQTYVPFSEKTYLYRVKNDKITVYIERETPGAGSGQTAFISNNKDNSAVQLYCGGCNDSEMNDIVSTFDFEVERDSVESFFNNP